MKRLILFTAMFSAVFLLSYCGDTEKPTTTDDEIVEGSEDGATLEDNGYVQRVPQDVFPHGFPTASAIVQKWIHNPKYDVAAKASDASPTKFTENNPDIIKHGWDIWAGLTHFTDVEQDGQKLRVFETWYTPNDIKTALNNDSADLDDIQPTKMLFKHPKQFFNNQEFAAAHANDELHPTQAAIIGFVKYNSASANFVYNNRLLDSTVIVSYLKTATDKKRAAIPNLPDSSILIKPVFYVLTGAVDGVYKFPAWPGEQGNNNRSWGPKDWNNDINVSTSKNTSNDVSVDDFIHHKLSQAEADYFNNNLLGKSGDASTGGKKAKAGDYAVLAGMHVTTREIDNWTWETFWWSQQQLQGKTPYLPSSKAIADLRPSNKIQGAANNYAMAIAYSMVKPAQKYTGGSDANASSLYAYNPYLEAGFGKAVFGSTRTVGSATADPQENSFGMQTNCMACHGRATYPDKSPGYATDNYLSRDDPYFKGTVALDFAMSIQANVISIPTPS